MVSDYYAMLGIDPGAERSVIESALARCQPLWSSGTRNPKTKHTHQSYLDQIPAIRQNLLSDPISRASYDTELNAARSAERSRKLDALQRLIKLRAAKGGLTVADRTLLRAETAKFGLDDADLGRLAEPFPPLPESPREADAADPVVETVDPVMRRQIRVALDHLRKRDLYDALDLPRDASIREIASRADGERQRWMKKSQVTAEKTAWLEVVTLAQSHLTTAVSRLKYDNMLILETEETFQADIEFALKGISDLDSGTKAVLKDEAATLGILPERAERLILRGCKALGVARGGSAEPAVGSLNGPTRYLRCRACSGLTNYFEVARRGDDPVCKHCGESLQWDCPVCKRKKWVDESRCACGFALEFRDPLIQHLESARLAFRSRQYSSALLHFRRVQGFAPNHAGARKGVDVINERLAEIEQARSAYELAKAGRRLLEAKAAIKVWSTLTHAADLDRKAAWAEVGREIAEALSLASRGRAKERTDPRAARNFYLKSLVIAADLPEALEGLRQTPPDPPSDLAADYVGGRVMLRWSPPPPDGLGEIAFVVLRKLDTAFKHPGDGVRIAESSAPFYEDRDVTPGTLVSYAVLTKRADRESSGAVAVGPIYLLGEVSNVRVDARAKEIDLFWVPPPNAAEVRVTRKLGSPPAGPTDGERVDALIDQAHDRNLETERVYHYAIYAVYRTPDGRSTASFGINIAAQPHTPVNPLAAPKVEPFDDGRLLIRWIEPTRGMVKLIRTARPLSKGPGERLSPLQVSNLEGDWIEVDALDHAIDKPPPIGLCYYTPLTTWGGNATVGHSAIFSRIKDPSDLQINRVSAGKVQLRWTWESTSAQTLILYKSGKPPSGPDDQGAYAETSYQTDYARQGHHAVVLPSGKPGPWHFSIHAVTFIDGEPVISAGMNPSARATIAGQDVDIVGGYSFSKPRFLSGRWWIRLKTEPPGETIPPTVLVTNPRAVPFASDDGMIGAEFPASSDGASYRLPRGLNPQRLHARLFLDPRTELSGHSAIKFRHPETGATRV